MAQKKKQLVAEGKLDKHGRPNENTPKEYLRSLPDVSPAKVCLFLLPFSSPLCQTSSKSFNHMAVMTCNCCNRYLMSGGCRTIQGICLAASVRPWPRAVAIGFGPARLYLHVVTWSVRNLDCVTI